MIVLMGACRRQPELNRTQCNRATGWGRMSKGKGGQGAEPGGARDTQCCQSREQTPFRMDISRFRGTGVCAPDSRAIRLADKPPTPSTPVRNGNPCFQPPTPTPTCPGWWFPPPALPRPRAGLLCACLSARGSSSPAVTTTCRCSRECPRASCCRCGGGGRGGWGGGCRYQPKVNQTWLEVAKRRQRGEEAVHGECQVIWGGDWQHGEGG